MQGWLTARARRFDEHRRWMIRSFALTFAAVTLRLYLPLGMMAGLSFNEMATIMSDVLGKPVRFQQTDFDAYKAQFLGFGMSDAMAQGMTDMARAKNEGLDNAELRTSANTTPTSFRQWCEDLLKSAVDG